MADYASPLMGPVFKGWASNGTPLAGGKLYSYVVGTEDKKTTWQDGAKATPNANPVILDNRGEASVFGEGIYKFELYTSADVLVWSKDEIMLLKISDDARSVIDQPSLADMRTALELGTAALLDAGSAAGEVLLIGDDGKLPAVNAENLTDVAAAAVSVPRSYLAGLTLSRYGNQAVGVAVGSCRDTSDTYGMKLAAALNKTFGSWAVGSGNGGLDTGVIANSTWYHVFVIYNATSDTTDVLISTNVPSPTMPSGYTYKRRIGSFLTDASAFIIDFDQIGDEFLWKDAPIDIDVDSVGTAAVTRTLTVPLGVIVEALLNVTFANPDSSASLYLSSLSVDDEAAAADTTAPLATIVSVTVAARHAAGPITIRTNTSQQIRSRANLANSSLDIVTLGWVDDRGRSL